MSGSGSAIGSTGGTTAGPTNLGFDGWLRRHRLLDWLLFLAVVFSPALFDLFLAVGRVDLSPARSETADFAIWAFFAYCYSGRRLRLDRDQKLKGEVASARVLLVDASTREHLAWWHERRDFPLIGRQPVWLSWAVWLICSGVVLVDPIDLDADTLSTGALLWILLYLVAITELWAARERRREAFRVQLAELQVQAAEDSAVQAGFDLNRRLATLGTQVATRQQELDEIERRVRLFNARAARQDTEEPPIRLVLEQVMEGRADNDQRHRDANRWGPWLRDHAIGILGGAIVGALLSGVHPGAWF